MNICIWSSEEKYEINWKFRRNWYKGIIWGKGIVEREWRMRNKEGLVLVFEDMERLNWGREEVVREVGGKLGECYYGS